MYSKEEYEKVALSVIASLYPEYENLAKRESPDYGNGTIGLEITIAVATEEGEVESFWVKNQSRKYSELPRKQLEKMGFYEKPHQVQPEDVLYQQKSIENGTFIYFKEKKSEDFILCAFFGTMKDDDSTIDGITEAVSRKLTKLNNKYTVMDRNELCVIVLEQINYFVCGEFIIDSIMKMLAKEVRAVYSQRKDPYQFGRIFVLFYDNLFCINTSDWTYERHIIRTLFAYKETE